MEEKEELFKKIERLDDLKINALKEKNKIMTNRGRKFEEEILNLPMNPETDSELVLFTKKIINEANITNKEVYDHFGQSLGYNMIYSLVKKKPAISWERVRQWIDFLGYNLELVLIRKKPDQKIDEGLTVIEKDPNKED